MQSKAPTVAKYLAALPPDRRAAIEAVRALVRASIDPDVEEGMQYGMISFHIPLRVYPSGYHVGRGVPLPYISLAAQKNGCSLYLMAAGYPDVERILRDGFARAGKRIDLGKSCLRFRTFADLVPDVVAAAIRALPSGEWIRRYEAARAGHAARAASAAKPEAQQKPARLKRSVTAKQSASTRSAPPARKK